MPTIRTYPLIMKTLQQYTESLLDTDFDIHDEDINELEEFLKKWKYGNKTKMTMPFGEFCKHLSYAGTEVPGASIKDVAKAIRKGNGFICVSNDKMHSKTNWCLYWSKTKTSYYEFDTVNGAAKWENPNFGSFAQNIEWGCSGLAGQRNIETWYLPNDCRFFELPPAQYEKFFKVFT